jgi:NADH:ubiquinone oxidoreductase subunit
MGTFMGGDAAGNRYYENRIDYPMGQHRWVEPGDIHNFDSTQVPPDWLGWLTHTYDATPSQEEELIAEQMKHLRTAEISHAPFRSNIGHREPYFDFNHMHNQSQIRSRGYGIGNHVVGLPPGAPDAYYTQPGSPYNKFSHTRAEPTMGHLDEGGGRPYKSLLWKERLKTAAEKQAEIEAVKEEWNGLENPDKPVKIYTLRELAIMRRGGTLPPSKNVA